jgi:ABC-type transporter Mla subunit MlaD
MPDLSSDYLADQALDGLSRVMGENRSDKERKATARALLALVAEQRSTNAHLNGITDSLARIANALERQGEQAEHALVIEPKRRWWQLSRHDRGDR